MEAGVIALLVALGGAILTPVATSVGKFVSLGIQLQTIKLANSHKDLIVASVTTGVLAAEQLAKSNQIAPEQRKDKAEEIANGLLKMGKIKIDTNDLISPIIEAQVWESFEPKPTTQISTNTTTNKAQSFTDELLKKPWSEGESPPEENPEETKG